MKEEKKVGYRDVLHQKEFLKIMIAGLINRFGDSIDAIASAWIVYEITGSAAWSAVTFGVNQLPSIIVTPLAGAWVEGRKKKNIMIVTDLIRALCVAIVATGYLVGFLQPWIIIITTLIISSAEAFRGPASSALIPKILEKDYFEFGLSLSATLSRIVELVGTAIAAGLIALIGVAGAIYIDMVTFVLSAIIIAFVNSKEKSLIVTKFNGKEYCRNLADGFSYIKKDKWFRFIMILSVFLNAILVPVNSLQAPFASEVLKCGAEVLSIFSVAITVGMLLGSVIYPYIGRKISERLICILGGLGIAQFYIILPLCRPFYSSKIIVYILLSLCSFIMGITVTIMGTHVSVMSIKLVKEEYLARMSGIATAMGVAAMPITSFLISFLVELISTSVFFIVSGIFAVIVTLIMCCSANFTSSNSSTGAQETQE